MGRPERVDTPGFHHVFTRGTGGSAFFHDDDDRLLLVQLLDQTRARLRWRIHAYCLMTTHYHVVVQTSAPNLSRGMQRVNSVYVREYNRRWGRYGTLVAGRFGSRVIESEEYLLEACQYVFLNPVKAELCERAQDWPWSGGLLASAMSSL